MADTFIDNAKSVLKTTAWYASYGLVVGSAAGFIATAIKLAKAVSFVNMGLATATGLGVNTLLTALSKKAEIFKGNTVGQDLVNIVAIHTISLLAAIYVMPLATMPFYTGAALVAGTLILTKLLENSPVLV